MKISKPNKIKEKIIQKITGLIYRLENIGNGDIVASGELSFINDLASYYNESITFFDIGANIGDYTNILGSKRNNLNDTYHLFEPQKSCFAEITNKFKDKKNIILNNIGLSNKNTEAIIYKDTEKSGLTSLFKRNLYFYNINMGIEEKILLRTAEEYIKLNNIRKINLIKIDVEGNEIRTLEGFGSYLNNEFIDFIQFEYGGANIDSRTYLMDFYTLLEPKGFKICKMTKKHIEFREYNPRMENFVCQNYVAVSKNIFDKLFLK